MTKRKEKTEFGKHHANVRKMSRALSGYGTVYTAADGRSCGLIAPSLAALERTFASLVTTQKFNRRLAKKVVLFELQSVSTLKAR